MSGANEVFAELPNGSASMLRSLAEQTGERKDTALENALAADVAATDDPDVRRSLVRAALRMSVNDAERASLRGMFAGREKSKLVTAREFDAWGKRYPLRKVSQVPANVPSAAPGHSLFFTASGSDGKPALMAVNRDGEAYPVFPGDFTVTETIDLRHITRDSTLGSSEGGAFVTRYVDPDGSETTATVSTDDLRARDPKFPNDTGISTRIAPAKIKRAADAIVSLGQGAPRKIAIAGTGPLRVGDGYVFLRQNKPAITATGFDADYRSVITTIGTDNGIHYLDFADPSEPGDQELADFLQYLRIADATPDEPHIAIAALCALAWSPCGPVSDLLPVNFLIHAETGKRKTSLAGLTTAAQSSHNLHLGPNSEPPVAVNMRDGQTTTFAADQLLYPMRGTFAAVDDLFAGRMTIGDEAKQWKFLSTNARNASSGSGGGRGAWSNNGGSVPSVKFPRSSNFYTAEKLPDEQGHSGALAAIAVVRMEHEVRTDILSELQEIANSGAFARAHSALIRSALPNFDLHRDALKTALQVAESWERTGHNRTQIQWRRILAGAYVLSFRYAELTGDNPRFLGDDFANLIREAQERQAMRSGMRNGTDITINPVRLFVKYAKQAFNNGLIFLAHRDMKQSDLGITYMVPVLPEGFAPSDVGWRATPASGYVPPTGSPVGAILKTPVNGHQLPDGYREYRAFVKKSEWSALYETIAQMSLTRSNVSLPSPEEMLSLLAKDSRYVISDKPQQVTELFGKRGERGYSFNILAILRGEMPGDGDGNGPGSDEPEPEPEPESGPQGEPESEPEPEPGYYTEPIPGTEPLTARKQATGLERDNGKKGVTVIERERDERKASALGIAPDGDGTAIYFRTDETNRGSLTVPVPTSLEDCYRLARKYQVTELWIHPDVMSAVKVPSLRSRESAAKKQGKTYGASPSEPIASKWANLPSDLACEPAYRGALSSWVPVWRSDVDRKDSEVAIVIPAYDSRTDFANAETAQELVNAVGLFNDALPGRVRFRWSPNSTMKVTAKHVSPKYRDPVLSVTREQIPAIKQYGQMLGAINWSREPQASEVRSGFLVMDRNAAEISGFSTDYIGTGEPEHVTGNVTFQKGKEAYYRLERQPRGYDNRLPELYVRPGSDGSLWITGPDAELLDSLGILPPVVEAWIWQDSGRYLSGTYRALKNGRELLDAKREESGGKIARSSFSQAWHSFIGELADSAGARRDSDNTYRPDIRDMIKAETYTRMYRSLMKIAETSGRYPVATHVDAVAYCATGPEDIPDGMNTDSRIGSYKFERWNDGKVLPWES